MNSIKKYLVAIAAVLANAAFIQTANADCNWIVRGTCPFCIPWYYCTSNPGQPPVIPTTDPTYPLDTSRGNCNYNHATRQCVQSASSPMNCWQCDDELRDGLDMNLAQGPESIVIKINRNSHITPRNGRYIWVYRSTDQSIYLRAYDRTNGSPGPACTRYYENNRFPDNYRNGQYLHVRHSQINGGWEPVLGAGELKMWNGKVVVMNNESGHFKPSVDGVKRAQAELIQSGVLSSDTIKIGAYQTNSAALTEAECEYILGR